VLLQPPMMRLNLESPAAESFFPPPANEMQKETKMRIPGKLWARLGKSRGQSMVEYTLVITGISLVALFSSYHGLTTIVVSSVNAVIALF
jgi:hypothetical protein